MERLRSGILSKEAYGRPKNFNMSLIENTFRYFLIAFSVITGILGIVGMALSSLAAFKKDIFLKGLSDIKPKHIVDQLTDQTVYYSACVLFVVSIVIVLISILGCYGGSNENRCMLCTYSIVMFILMLLNLIFLCLLSSAQSRMEEEIQTGLWMAMNETKDDEELSKVVDQIFINNECCGVDSPEDLNGYDHISCYTMEGNVVGCKERLDKYINRSFTAIKVISIITAIFQNLRPNYLVEKLAHFLEVCRINHNKSASVDWLSHVALMAFMAKL
ncbi:23 kDa integral membrane protein-like [Octopus sinensis]|uniref:23 kDa integral membrane protein-like n=1 Tax=Octopus sinensis TaxID=2607531 RepID=A0A7E6EQD0_9MOLL|nr:23 kDa integral membrane protein-like [Octopus sinensis]